MKKEIERGSQLAKRHYSTTMTVNGEKNGDITSGAGTADAVGQNAQAENTDAALVYNVMMRYFRDVDENTGQVSATSNVMGEVAVVCPRTGTDFPIMFQAMTDGDPLTVTITENRMNPTGNGKEAFVTTTLTDAQLVEIERPEDNGSYQDEIVIYRFVTKEIKIEGNVASKSADVKLYGT